MNSTHLKTHKNTQKQKGVGSIIVLVFFSIVCIGIGIYLDVISSRNSEPILPNTQGVVTKPTVIQQNNNTLQYFSEIKNTLNNEKNSLNTINPQASLYTLPTIELSLGF